MHGFLSCLLKNEWQPSEHLLYGVSVLSNSSQNRMYPEWKHSVWGKDRNETTFRTSLCAHPWMLLLCFQLLNLLLTFQWRCNWNAHLQQHLHGMKHFHPYTLILTYTVTAGVGYNSIKYCFGNYKHSDVVTIWYLFFCLQWIQPNSHSNTDSWIESPSLFL